VARLRRQYLQDTQKLSREKRRMAKLEKQLSGQSVDNAVPQAIERRLSEVEKKIDKVLHALEASKKTPNR
jgi:hypothetical protein